MTCHVSHLSFILIVRGEQENHTTSSSSYSFGSGAVAGILKFSISCSAKEDQSPTVSNRLSEMMAFNAAVCSKFKNSLGKGYS